MYFQSNLNFEIMVNQALQTKQKYQPSINNIILCLDITWIHKSLNKLLLIPKHRICHTWWLLQIGRVRKEDPWCFSSATSSRVSNTSHILPIRLQFTQWLGLSVFSLGRVAQKKVHVTRVISLGRDPLGRLA